MTLSAKRTTSSPIAPLAPSRFAASPRSTSSTSRTPLLFQDRDRTSPANPPVHPAASMQTHQQEPPTSADTRRAPVRQPFRPEPVHPPIQPATHPSMTRAPQSPPTVLPLAFPQGAAIPTG